MGPGELEMAHAPEESVSFQQVCLATQLYLDLLMNI
jgi:acetylornithine deacetylase/succinyl-diaminopimelate desuccinylase-like protein